MSALLHQQLVELGNACAYMPTMPMPVPTGLPAYNAYTTVCGYQLSTMCACPGVPCFTSQVWGTPRCRAWRGCSQAIQSKGKLMLAMLHDAAMTQLCLAATLFVSIDCDGWQTPFT